jgi:hypothetical protein
MGVAILAAAGLMYLVLQQQEPESSVDGGGIKKKPVGKNDDSKKSVDVTSEGTTEESKPEMTVEKLGTGKLDEKALHAKIEELDKKGKAYFKNKKVSFLLEQSEQTCSQLILRSIVFF